MGVDGPELNLVNVALSALPILVLITAILGLKWSAPRAGALSWLVAAAVALLFFGADARLVAIGSSKGLSLSIFVLAIVWSAVFLYNLIDQLGGIEVIGTTISRLVRDPLAQALVVGWAFSGFIQGIAGFGVPVAVVAPLLMIMGFSPIKAAAIGLVGHAWAVTFGSLGSSYYTIQLVTGIDGDVIGPQMAAMFSLPIILSGFAVAHLEGGLASVRRAAPAVILIGGAMALGLWATAFIGAPQITSIVAGLIGCGIGWLVSRSPLLSVREQPEEPAVASHAPEPVGANPHSKARMSFHLAFLPYYLLLMLSAVSQVPAVKEMVASLAWGLDYPATVTSMGYSVDAQDNYAQIGLMRHPAPLIILSLAMTYLVYRLLGRWRSGAGLAAVRRTYSQCMITSAAIPTMVMMALVMTDVGMTVLLGRSIADGTGAVFPIFSPYLGVLGTFMTGSNTASNVMFGTLQTETAKALGVGTVTVASVQSIGGSLASSIAPAKVLVATTIVGLSGRESEVLRRTIPYCIGIVLLVGVEAWLLLYVFSTR